MNPNELIKRILKDVEVELKDEFDRNFERKAFFDRSWPKNKLINRRGSQMARTNNLRRSLRANISGDRIVFSSSLPYASIHNEGGTVVVTAKMKRFFWSKYYKAAGAISRSVLLKDGSRHLFVSTDSKERMAKQLKSKSQRAIALNMEAKQWKNLALMKVGQTVKIPERRFIGEHPRIREVLFCFGFLKSECIPKKEIPAFY
ncbi:MAG: hypothetical protein WCY16_09315 [Weeksellaceae bacterium]